MSNHAVKLLGVDLVLRYISEVSEHYKVTVMSVGSGRGQIEAAAENVDWVCVDPDPTSFSKGELHRAPDYDYVDSAIKARPELVGKCVVFLNWCPPNGDHRFDVEAIEKLKPLAVLSTYEIYFGLGGAAGSDDFHDWLDAVFEGKNDYQQVSTTRLSDETLGRLDVRISWLHLRDRGPAPVTKLPRQVHAFGL